MLNTDWYWYSKKNNVFKIGFYLNKLSLNTECIISCDKPESLAHVSYAIYNWFLSAVSKKVHSINVIYISFQHLFDFKNLINPHTGT